MHIPALQKEVLEYLDPKPNENFIDCTIDGGEHALSILEKIEPGGRVLGIDLDSELIRHLKFKIQKQPYGESASRPAKFKNNLLLVCDSYTNLKKIVEKYKFGPVAGILFDLGMSSWHLEKSGRGFSFLRDEPLDMRYNFQFPIPNFQLTAEKILNSYSQEEIEKILMEYGEERFARKIAKKIVEERKIKPIKTTFQLVEIIKKAIPVKYRQGKIHFATRTFQSLRIAVNDELNNLKKGLLQTIEVLKKGGRIVIISFHSLEDRIVKNFFRENSQYLKTLTKKPITPFSGEIKINPRSRSAKLRAAIKI